eukprot:jgi/Mesen1/7838/ME000419S07153
MAGRSYLGFSRHRATPSTGGDDLPDGVDAKPRCQGCGSVFTMVLRKHHCRRCDGLFCSACSSARVVLPTHGDVAVRVCDACKAAAEKEKADARLAKRHARSGGAAVRKGEGIDADDEDALLAQILGGKGDSHELPAGKTRRLKREADEAELLGSLLTASWQGSAGADSRAKKTAAESFPSSAAGDDRKIADADGDESGTASDEKVAEFKRKAAAIASDPGALRDEAAKEKARASMLRREGLTDFAHQAFQRAKDLERRAAELERPPSPPSRSTASPPPGGDAGSSRVGGTRGEAPGAAAGAASRRAENNGSGPKQGGRGAALALLGKGGRDADDEKDPEIMRALKDLGWSDDAQAGSQKGAAAAGGAAAGSGSAGAGVDARILGHKRKALLLKRQGDLEGAKEELKRAKGLEARREELEILGADFDDSDGDGDGDDDEDDEFGDLDVDAYEEQLRNPMRSGSRGSAAATVGSRPGDQRWASASAGGGGLDMRMLAAIQDGDGDGGDDAHDVEVTDADMDDPELAAELLALTGGGGGGGGGRDPKEKEKERRPPDGAAGGAALQSSVVLGMKQRALQLKREGRLQEAAAQLGQAKAVERQMLDAREGAKASAVRSATWQAGGSGSSSSPAADLQAISRFAAANAEDEDDGDEIPVEVTEADERSPEMMAALRDLGWAEEGDDEPVSASAPAPAPSRVVPAIAASVGPHPAASAQTAARPASSSGGGQARPAGAPAGGAQAQQAELAAAALKHKRSALALKRSGQLAEAAAELKQAKAIEQQLEALRLRAEEQEHRAGNGQNGATLKEQVEHEEDDQEEEGPMDPEIAAALKSMGWKEEVEEEEPVPSARHATQHQQPQPLKPAVAPGGAAAERRRAELQKGVHEQKLRALHLKREGRGDAAREALLEAKALEAQLASLLAQQQQEQQQELEEEEQGHGVHPAGATVSPQAMQSKEGPAKLQQQQKAAPGSSRPGKGLGQERRRGRRQEEEDEFEFEGEYGEIGLVADIGAPLAAYLHPHRQPQPPRTQPQPQPQPSRAGPAKAAVAAPSISQRKETAVALPEHNKVNGKQEEDGGEGGHDEEEEEEEEEVEDIFDDPELKAALAGFGFKPPTTAKAPPAAKPRPQSSHPAAAAAVAAAREPRSGAAAAPTPVAGLKAEMQAEATSSGVAPSSSAAAAAVAAAQGEEVLRHSILEQKQRAVALKRAGNAHAALEALQQAKLLERQLEATAAAAASGSSAAGTPPRQAVAAEAAPPPAGAIRSDRAASYDAGDREFATGQAGGNGGGSGDDTQRARAHEASSRMEPARLDEAAASGAAYAGRGVVAAAPGGLQDQIMAHKRRALALKREGDLAGAMQELKQAKALESQAAGAASAPSVTKSTSPALQPGNDNGLASSSGRGQQDQGAEPPVSQTRAAPQRRAPAPAPARPHPPRLLPDDYEVDDDDDDVFDAQLMANLRSLGLGGGGGGGPPARSAPAPKKAAPTPPSSRPAAGTAAAAAAGGPKAPVIAQQRGGGGRAAPPKQAPAGAAARPPPVSSAAAAPRGALDLGAQREQLQSRIKAEKMRALELKRVGKGTEALEALRSAKRLELQLQAPAS